MGGFEKVLTALDILLVLIVVLYLSYLCTRYVGKRARGVGFGGSAQHIRVLEQSRCSQDASVALLQVSERLFLVGVTPQNVSLLAEIDDDSLLQDLSQPSITVFPACTDRKTVRLKKMPSFRDMRLRMRDRK